MNWLCVVLLVFLALSVANGARKGLVRMVVSLVFMILVMGLASVLHPYVSSYMKENTKIYDTVLDGCSRVMNERLRQQQEELTMAVQVEIIDSLPLPEGMKDGLLRGNNAEAWEALSVDRFPDYLAVYLADLIIRAAAFLISYAAAFLVVKIGQNIAYMLSSLPGISLLNRAAGAAFGLVQACIWIELFFILVMLVQDTDFGQVLIAAVQENAVLSRFYNDNILWYLLARFML